MEVTWVSKMKKYIINNKLFYLKFAAWQSDKPQQVQDENPDLA